MTRTLIPASTIVRAGVTQATAVWADITNSHYISANDGRIFLELINASNASSVDITFDVVPYYDGDLTIVDLIVAVAPGSTLYAGPFKRNVFNQSDNTVNVNVGSTGISFRGYSLSS